MLCSHQRFLYFLAAASALKKSARLLAMVMQLEMSAMARKKTVGLEKRSVATCLKKSAKVKFAAGLESWMTSKQENSMATALRARKLGSAFV